MITDTNHHIVETWDIRHGQTGSVRMAKGEKMASVKLTLDVEAVKEWLEKANMVAVVRCKECKWYKTMYCKMDRWTDLVTVYVAKKNDYCSYGKRREDEL